MTLWDDYEIFDPQVDRPLAEVTPSEARAHYVLVMETKEHRVAELKKLARAARIELDGSEEALQRFNDWFVMYVKPDPDRPEQARGRWLSVCHDLSLYLADLIIARHPHLHWKLHKSGKRNVSYQRPVLVGFRNAHPTYSVDLDFALTQYAGGLVRREQEDRDFLRAAAPLARQGCVVEANPGRSSATLGCPSVRESPLMTRRRASRSRLSRGRR